MYQKVRRGKVVTKIKLTPVGDRLAVIFDEFVETMATVNEHTGAVFQIPVPKTHSERSRAATVMAVGTDPETQAMFKAGDRIILSWHAGVRLHLLDKIVYGKVWDEDLLRVVRTDEVVTKVEEIPDGPDYSYGSQG